MSEMLFKEKFNALAKSADVQEDERAVAEFFWYAGLRHAFQRGTSQAALLTPAPTVPRQEPVALNPWAGLMKHKKDTYVYGDSELSPYEAKIVSLAMQHLLSSVQYQLSSFEKEVNSLWKHCDKADPSTKNVFDMMNKGRTKLRILKKQTRTLNEAQRKLKRLAKGL